MRPRRKTNTDRLEACETWQEVVDCPLYDDWIKTVPTNDSWLNSFPLQYNPREDPEAEQRYGDLVELAKSILTDREADIFFAYAEQDKSFRVLGLEHQLSHECVRSIFKSARSKMQAAIGA
jgi:hypothetical protein